MEPLAYWYQFREPTPFHKADYEWREKVTTYHPEKIQNIEYQNVYKLFPASESDDIVAYYFQEKSEWSHTWEEKVVQNEESPKTAGHIRSVTPLTVQPT